MLPKKSELPAPGRSRITQYKFSLIVLALMNKSYSRRSFLKTSAASCAGVLVLENSLSLRTYAANEKLNLALVGVTGRAGWFVQTMPGLGCSMVAMCDVNLHRAGPVFAKYPAAQKFRDFRVMLDKMAREIDAVTVAIPDNTHAVAAMAAIKRGKPVLCEKPLTHDVFESRALRLAAREFKVATQMGNQGTSSEAFRRSVELIQAGVLGEVREVHAWKDGGGSGPREAPKGDVPIPDDLDWALWLGPAAERAYHPLWMKWHGWRDFATGNLGNWAPHSMNLPFKALRLDTLWDPNAPEEWRTKSRPIVKVQAQVSAIHGVSFPQWEIIRYDFPARGSMPPVRINYYNGSGNPEGRNVVEKLMGRKLDWGDAGAKKWDDHGGCLVVGSKGMIHTIAHNTTLTVLPEDKFKDFDQNSVPKTLPRSRGHEREWLDACKGGAPAMSNFDYSGPLTEFCLLGNVATLVEQPFDYDPIEGKVTDNPKANGLLRREYRKGWEL